MKVPWKTGDYGKQVWDMFWKRLVLNPRMNNLNDEEPKLEGICHVPVVAELVPFQYVQNTRREIREDFLRVGDPPSLSL